MAENYAQQVSSDQSGRLRDIEDRQRLLKDRILLVGQTLLDERDKNFKQVQEMKKNLLQIKEEHTRMKELLERVAEQLNNSARKEELMIIQRQIDLLRK